MYEDNHLLAIEKPAGMLMAGDATGDENLLDLGKQYIKVNYSKPGAVFLGLVHRLDRPVSGVALFARTSKAARRLAEQFRTNSIQKTYLAWVYGRAQTHAILEDYLQKDEARNFTSVVEPTAPRSKLAQLSYRLIQQQGRYSLLEVKPQTGRSHQIRVQLASRNLPIVGDVKYGSATTKRPQAIALHAYSLEFLHPTKKQPISISIPAHENWLSSFV